MWWLARNETAVPADVDWLTVREARRAAGMRFARRRTGYLLRRLVAKHAVAAVAGLPADPRELARIEVLNAPTGVPYVRVDGAPIGLEVSLTDRAGWAVCLVGAGRFGCDLELVEPRSTGFVRDFFTVAEQRYVGCQPDRDLAANLVWSAKESALKALRTGLGRDTRSVEVTVHSGSGPGWHGLTVRTREGTVHPGWWRRDGQLLLTVAASVAVPPPVALEPPYAPSAAMPRSSASIR